MTHPNGIGSARQARDLEVGDHVRLPDGRWALVLDITGSKRLPSANSVPPEVSVGLLVNLRDTEAATYAASEWVWSRSPEQQIEAMETLISDLREKAIAAAGGVR